MGQVRSCSFKGRQGRLLLALGGFPVRRGESDLEAMATARAVLDRRRSAGAVSQRGHARPRPDRRARRAEARGPPGSALETDALLVPAAITGTEKLFLFGFFPKPHRVQVAFAEPIDLADRTADPETAAAVLGDELWPQVSEEFQRLRARPGLIAAGVAAAGLGIALQQRRRRR